MEHVPDDYLVYIVTAAGSSEEKIQPVKLYELDREMSLNNLTTIYVPPVADETILYHQFRRIQKDYCHAQRTKRMSLGSKTNAWIASSDIC